MSRRLLMRIGGVMAFFSIFTEKSRASLNSEGKRQLDNYINKGSEQLIVDECSCLDELYKFSPTSIDQMITLKRAIKNGPIINARLFYDGSDTTSKSDGYSIFISANRFRWKVDLSGGVDVRLAGLLLDGSNLGSCINKIIAGEVAKLQISKSLFSCITTIFIPAKINGDNDSHYVLDEPITLPSFFCLKTNGFVRIFYPNHGQYAVRISNDILNIPSNSMVLSPTDVQGSKFFDAGGGRFVLSGNKNSRSVSSGIYIGNSNPHSFAVRDLLIEDITVQYFKSGIEFSPKNNFINTFNRVNVLLCKYGFYVSGENSISAGEKIIFNDCVFGNNESAHFYLSAQISYYINNCSLDYTGGNVFYISSSSALSRLMIDKGHIEGVPGFLVYCPDKLPLPLKIQFRDVMLYINGALHNSMRQLIYAPVGNCHVIFDGCDWTFTDYFENEQYIALTGYDDGSDSNNRVSISNALPRVTGLRSKSILSQYKNGLMGDRFDFQGVKGQSLLNKTDDNSKIAILSQSNEVNVLYGDKDSDKTQIIEIISASDNVIVDVTNILYHSTMVSSLWSGGCSVKLEDIVSESCYMYFVVESYKEPSFYYDQAKAQVVCKRDILDTYVSDEIDLKKVFYVEDSKIKSDAFIGIWQSIIQNKYAHSCKLKIRFKNFQGKIKIKLPVFWKG